MKKYEFVVNEIAKFLKEHNFSMSDFYRLTRAENIDEFNLLFKENENVTISPTLLSSIANVLNLNVYDIYLSAKINISFWNSNIFIDNKNKPVKTD